MKMAVKVPEGVLTPDEIAVSRASRLESSDKSLSSSKSGSKSVTPVPSPARIAPNASKISTSSSLNTSKINLDISTISATSKNLSSKSLTSAPVKITPSSTPDKSLIFTGRQGISSQASKMSAKTTNTSTNTSTISSGPAVDTAAIPSTVDTVGSAASGVTQTASEKSIGSSSNEFKGSADRKRSRDATLLVSDNEKAKEESNDENKTNLRSRKISKIASDKVVTTKSGTHISKGKVSHERVNLRVERVRSRENQNRGSLSREKVIERNRLLPNSWSTKTVVNQSQSQLIYH
jgi:hypothetical protein